MLLHMQVFRDVMLCHQTSNPCDISKDHSVFVLWVKQPKKNSLTESEGTTIISKCYTILAHKHSVTSLKTCMFVRDILGMVQN
jgi:hypothetical protein